MLNEGSTTYEKIAIDLTEATSGQVKAEQASTFEVSDLEAAQGLVNCR